MDEEISKEMEEVEDTTENSIPFSLSRQIAERVNLSDKDYIASLPSGYRFVPTDEELIQYLKKKVNNEVMDPNRIVEAEVYSYSPEELLIMQDDYEEVKDQISEWYFFTARNRKYAKGTRPDRRAGDGFWKATAADKQVLVGQETVGSKRTLTFRKGKPPEGEKTNWLMHEYVLSSDARKRTMEGDMKLNEWVLCKVYLNRTERHKKAQDFNSDAAPQGYDGRFCGFGEYPGQKIKHAQGNLLMPPHTSPLSENVGYVAHSTSGNFREGNTKIFGVPLISSPSSAEQTICPANYLKKPMDHLLPVSHQFLPSESDERSKLSQFVEDVSGFKEKDISFQLGWRHAREIQSSPPSASSRSCTKGIALGRSVDLNKFNNYEELIAELDTLFEFRGELMAPEKNWLVVYTDEQGDMMVVGDDPWQEFCALVRRIGIYSKQELQKMKPGPLCSTGEDNPVSSEGLQKNHF